MNADSDGDEGEENIIFEKIGKHVGDHSKQEIKAEIEKKQEWAKEVSVIKIKDYTHVLKIEFSTLEAADKALEKGVLMFYMMVTPERVHKYPDML